jgi:hypothetical protein
VKSGGTSTSPRGPNIPEAGTLADGQSGPLLPPPRSCPLPAAASRGKGGPEAHPRGTRSALPATDAAGTMSAQGSWARASAAANTFHLEMAAPTWRPQEGRFQSSVAIDVQR